VAFVLGGSVVRQWLDYPLLETSFAGLAQTGLFAPIVIFLALASQQVGWRAGALSAAVMLWTAAPGWSAFMLEGRLDSRSLLLALTSMGIVLGAAVAPATALGWLLVGVGAAYVQLNLWGAAAQLLGSGQFEGFVSASGGWPPWYMRGLSTNGNLTGNFLLPLLAFVTPFLLSRSKAFERRFPGRGEAITGAVLIATLLPGAVVLSLAGARSAAGALLVGLATLLVPHAWCAQKRFQRLASVVAPLLVLGPVVLVTVAGGLLSLSGRDCVWANWLEAMRGPFGSLLLGIGPEATFSGTSCRGGGNAVWVHVHNELLQSVSTGGVIGLLGLLLTLGLLARWSVQHRAIDSGALLVVLTASLVLMGVEVLSSFRHPWIHLGIAALLAVAGRSLGMVDAQVRTRGAPITRPVVVSEGSRW
jgi:hypothetical protein